jgi:hypothetical protein
MSNNKHTVYYAFNSEVTLDLEPLLPNLKKKYGYKGSVFKDVLRCYALQEDVKNTFIYKSPISINIKYKDDKNGYEIFTNLKEDNQYDFESLATSGVNESEIVQLLYRYGVNFISEKNSLPFTICATNYHKTDVSNIPMVTGSYDCGKWFRSIFLAVLNIDKKDFSIKQGEPLFYIKFHTDDHIHLEKFDMSKKADEVMLATTTYKHSVSNTPLSKLYKLFEKTEMKSILIQAIKSEKI